MLIHILVWLVHMADERSPPPPHPPTHAQAPGPSRSSSTNKFGPSPSSSMVTRIIPTRPPAHGHGKTGGAAPTSSSSAPYYPPSRVVGSRKDEIVTIAILPAGMAPFCGPALPGSVTGEGGGWQAGVNAGRQGAGGGGSLRHIVVLPTQPRPHIIIIIIIDGLSLLTSHTILYYGILLFPTTPTLYFICFSPTAIIV